MNKIVVITGATGFVGKKLTLALFRRGYEIRVITRNKKKAQKVLPLPLTFLEWNGSSDFPVQYLEGAGSLIHLAGEPIAERRWTNEVKKRIYSSRVDSTQKIMRSLEKVMNGPEVVVGTSAIGIYGNRSDEVLTEVSSHGNDYLTKVCEDWENSYQNSKARVAILRVGVVLGHGGALDKMLPPFRMGVGGTLGLGKQWMSWIHINDLVNLYIHALENDVFGALNAVSPGVVTNKEFTRALAKTLGRPAIFPVPPFALKIMFGEMSQVLLGSQRVSSAKTESTGFHFQHKTIEGAFKNLLSPLGHYGEYVHEAFKWLPKKREDVFPFFCEAKNLEVLTPAWLNFHIEKISTPKIEEGTLIDYKLKIKGVPVKWRTRIISWSPLNCFVDEQLHGPYKMWHHTHSFEEVHGGTLMLDRVVYRMPFGVVGDAVRLAMVQKDVENIFDYRSEAIEKVFQIESKVL